MSTGKSISLAAGAAALLLGTTLSVQAGASTATARPVAQRAAVVQRHVPPPAITAGEAARLRYQVQQYNQLKRRAAADGAISRREQALLNEHAAKIRRLIHTAKTN